jgi:hypothetical protein
MNKLKEQIAELLEIRSVIAILITFTFVVLSFLKMVSAENVMVVVTLVLGFFFGNKATRDKVE